MSFHGHFAGSLPARADGVAAPALLSHAATLSLDGGQDGFYRVVLTGNTTLAVPANGVDGARLRLWLVASGADRTVTLDGAMVIPAASTLASPFTVADGTKTKLLLEYDASREAWEVTSHVPGY